VDRPVQHHAGRLASLLDRSGLEVVGQAGTAAELTELVGQLWPELAVVDIRMPPNYSTDGLEAARVIQREFPDTAVVVLSALKSRVTDIAEFIDTLKRVARGGSAVDPALVQELVAARRADDPLAAPTARAGRSRPEAAVAGDRRGSSSRAGRAGRACLLGCALTPRLLLAAMRAMSPAGNMVECSCGA
jgi:CheY-like chemotaxis protein